MKYAKQLKRAVLYSSIVTFPNLLEGRVHAAEPGGMIEAAQQKAYEISGKDVAILKFNKGSSTLSSKDQSELRTMYNAVKEDSRVVEIVVAAYSDLDYPKSGKSDLPHKSKTLAGNRGAEVRNFLTELGAKKVRVVNMAQKANWFERTFDTKDAQVKRGADENPTVHADDKFFESLGKHLQTTGEPSDVVVVIRHE